MKSSAHYVCATIDIFQIQVLFIVGDFDECCKLIERYRSKTYSGPKVSDDLRDAKKEIDTNTKDWNGYRAFTTKAGPGIVIYAPEPIAIEVLVHEISHAVDGIFHITGANDEELRAYLCGYLFTEFSAHKEMFK